MQDSAALFPGMWGWMRTLCTWLLELLQFLAGLTGNWGVAIILLALLVRLVLYPFARRALHEQKRFNETQRILKPQLAEIKARYRGGEQAEHIEELYRAHGVSPVAGMKPLLLVLLQLPILVALFQILLHAPDLKNAAFLWIADLSQPDRMATLWMSLPWFGSSLNILPFALAASTMLGALFIPGEGDRAVVRKALWTGLAMAVVFFVLFYSFPAGLVLYWIATNLLAAGQQAIVARRAK
jgi:YidC/Oxa1 family membrane protein insertase